MSTELFAYRHRPFFYFDNAFTCPSNQQLLSTYVCKVLLAVVTTIFLSTGYAPAPVPRTLCALFQLPQQTHEMVLLIPILQKRILNAHFSKTLWKEMVELGI